LNCRYSCGKMSRTARLLFEGPVEKERLARPVNARAERGGYETNVGCKDKD
jgi:hypothetical protein